MAFKFNSLGGYSDIIDVRSQSEYQEDHIPGATNLPVLTDGQRHEVGLLHKRDRFAARKLGMGLVAGNISKMADGFLKDKGRDWKPLVYCWRGGARSESLVVVLGKVGWRAEAIPGGYKSYRRHVIESLDTLPGRFDWHVLRGPTGAGKTLLLTRLADAGCQCLDLEGLANHRGSLFGSRGPQPGQKKFESAVCAALKRLDAKRPVFVESESRKVGDLRVPPGLMSCMRNAKVVDVKAELEARAALTARDYVSYNDPKEFRKVAAGLEKIVGRARVAEWNELLRQQRHVDLARSLLESHYDPSYARSFKRHYGNREPSVTVSLDPNDERSVADAVMLLQGVASAR